MSKLRKLKRQMKVDPLEVAAVRAYELLTPQEWAVFESFRYVRGGARPKAKQADVMVKLVNDPVILKGLRALWVEQGVPTVTIGCMSNPQWWREQVEDE